jgi:hypothetical protein
VWRSEVSPNSEEDEDVKRLVLVNLDQCYLPSFDLAIWADNFFFKGIAICAEDFFSHPPVCFFTTCAALYAPGKKVLLTCAELLLNLNPPNFFFSVKFTLKKSSAYVNRTFQKVLLA